MSNSNGLACQWCDRNDIVSVGRQFIYEADLHRRSLAWWNEKLSERAVAQVIARYLAAPSGSEKSAA
jgi:hypothetical protein